MVYNLLGFPEHPKRFVLWEHWESEAHVRTTLAGWAYLAAVVGCC